MFTLTKTGRSLFPKGELKWEKEWGTFKVWLEDRGHSIILAENSVEVKALVDMRILKMTEIS